MSERSLTRTAAEPITRAIEPAAAMWLWPAGRRGWLAATPVNEAEPRPAIAAIALPIAPEFTGLPTLKGAK